MRKMFKEYHFNDPDIEEDFFKNAIIVLDTNTILNLYRYTNEGQKDFFKILNHKDIKDRLYLPYHIGFEFYQNREHRMNEGKKSKKNLIKSYKNKIKELKEVHVSGDVIAFTGERTNLTNEIIKEIESLETVILSKIEETETTENFIEIFTKILEIFDGKVGKKLTDEELKEIEKEGEERYNQKIPPGYEDESKENGNKFGDLIIWKDMIEYSKEQKKNMLFISNDNKEDWLFKIDDNSYGARKELLKEFKKESGGQIFYIAPTAKFIEKVGTYFNIENLDELKIQENKIVSIEKKLIKDFTRKDGRGGGGSIPNILDIDPKDYKKFKSEVLELSHMSNSMKKAILSSQIGYLNVLNKFGLEKNIGIDEKIRLLERIVTLIGKEEKFYKVKFKLIKDTRIEYEVEIAGRDRIDIIERITEKYGDIYEIKWEDN